MTANTPTDRILQASTGEATFTPADACALRGGDPQQVTDMLSRLMQAGVIVIQGDVNVARDNALLVTRSNVQLTAEQDVILQALESFRQRMTQDRAAQTQVRVAEYLAAMREYCANLPYLTLHDIRPPKTLDEVYVPLKARPQPRKDERQGREKEEWQELDEERAMREMEHNEPLSIIEVMQKREQPHIFILGEPGAGKSTLLRQLAEHAWGAPEKIGLDAPYLPILVPLRRLAVADGSLEERLGHALSSELTLTQKLPEGFFPEWPKHTGVRWLILLDALDEVLPDERARLMQWLRGMLKSIGQSRVVITSRPSGYTPGELDEKLFGHYDLLPFTPEQTGEFARKWFGDKANDFLRELERVRAGTLSGTPLLLTIAAKVYFEKGALPERRSGLYGQFVDIWLAEAGQRGMKAELGERICKVAKFALAKLALVMTEQPNQISRAMLGQVTATYLRDALHLSDDEAEADGCKFVQVMARRSGVFIRHGDAYDFIHSTFRGYLAAEAVVREHTEDLEQIWQWAMSRWVDENWREVILFVLGVLSDVNKDVTALIKRVWLEGGKAGLYFAGTAVAEQVNVQESLVYGLIDDLFAWVYMMPPWDMLFSPNPISILGELHGYSHVGNGLLMLVRDEEMYEQIRFEAIKALGNLGRVDDLLSLLCDKNVDEMVRGDAAEALGKLGWSRSAPMLLELAHEKDIHGWERLRATEALGKLGLINEAASILLTIAQDEKMEDWVCEHATEILGSLGRVDDLSLLAYNEKADKWVRKIAAETLGQLGWTEKAAQALLILAHDRKTNRWLRQSVAEALFNLGCANGAISILLALARDKRVNNHEREKAIKTLEQFADSRILPGLKRIAREDKEKVVREAAQQAVKQIRQRMKDISNAKPFTL